MGENKRFYWMKLKENFFDDDTINYIEDRKNGEKYVLFYLKLCLKALKSEGHLIRCVGNVLIPYDIESLAKLTRTDIDTVRIAMTLFFEIGLISKMDTGELYLEQINELIGTETDKAEIMRKSRAKLKGNNVTPMLPDCDQNVTQSQSQSQELELDIENRDRDKFDRRCVNASVPEPEEVFRFYHECRLPISPERFWNLNQENKWVDENGLPIMNWQGAYIRLCEKAREDEKYDLFLEFDISKYKGVKEIL